MSCGPWGPPKEPSTGSGSVETATALNVQRGFLTFKLNLRADKDTKNQPYLTPRRMCQVLLVMSATIRFSLEEKKRPSLI